MNILKMKFKILGMHCSSCAINIDFDLEDLDGVKSVKTNFAKQEAEISFDATITTKQRIIEEINKLGYKAEEM